MKSHFWFFALMLAIVPFSAQAAPVYDIQIPSGAITIERVPVMLGEATKIYVTVDNIGNKDVEGTAIFEDNGTNIGTKAVSAKATGRAEEIWQIWTPKTTGNHVLKVSLLLDENISDATPGNNQAQVTIFVDKDTDGDGIGDSVDSDIDGDGVSNAQDQYPLDPSKSKDTDGDGIDDSKDSDIDNDGIYNWTETSGGTNPAKYDTDGDGYGDKEDAYPLDPKRWKTEEPTTPATLPAPNATITEDRSSNNQTALGDTPTSNMRPDTDVRVAFAASTSSLQITPTSTAEILVTTSSQEIITSSTAPIQMSLGKDQLKIEDEKKSKNLNILLWSIAVAFGGLAGLFIWLAKKGR